MKRRAGLSAWASGCLFSLTVSAQAPPVEVRVLDDQGVTLDAKHAQASLSRTLPPELGDVPGPDHDALEFLLIAPPDAALDAVEAVTLGPQGSPLDVIVNLRTETATCPDGVSPELVCRQTPPLRLVGDGLDRSHPAVSHRSLRAELGGTLRLAAGRQTLVELPIGAPRELSALRGQRLRARLRVLVLRAQKHGAPALGGNEAGARQLMQRELGSAAALWAQCGIDLGQGAKSTIELVDPPTAQLFSVGCGRGAAASGGALRLQSGERRVALETRPGESPIAVALRLSEALKGGRKLPQVFENQRAAGDAVPTADVLLDGARRWQRQGNEPFSTDATLPLCLGEVDLNDGLSHFGDADAFTGTLEERALLRAFDDGDPRSVEVLVVPQFERGERIGESFIVSPGSSLSSSVIIDRTAIAAGARSFALAHELGHVFLGMPGHPDDFGVDQSWSLMDSDVADDTIFGPRRLSIADCQRALTQSGPSALTPLLESVPLR